MSEIKLHEGVKSIETWWKYFFGLHGRELGTKSKTMPIRQFTDDPEFFIDFIEKCDKETNNDESCRQCWMSVLIFSDYGSPCGIDKIFFDFDDNGRYCPKCKKYYEKHSEKIGKIKELGLKHACLKHKIETIVKPRKKTIGKEIIKFIENIESVDGFEPLVVETYKGYHVYLFLNEIVMFDIIDKEYEEFVKLIYNKLRARYLGQKKWVFLDSSSEFDIKRLARVPLTRHEKDGKICLIINKKTLKEDKIRSINFFRQFGIPKYIINDVILNVKKEMIEKLAEKQTKLNTVINDINNGTTFKKGFIRLCFKKRLEAGEMTHNMRLAFRIELYRSGYDDEEKMVNVFKQNMSDYDEKITRYQVQDFFKHEPNRYLPYKCITLYKKGWCLGNVCSLYEKNVLSKLNLDKTKSLNRSY